jgi:hypothetical protein
MADRELIDGLIGTYRDLNNRVRPLAEDRLALKGDKGSIRDVVRRMRNDELRFSQALKERISGVGMTEVFGADAEPVLGTEQSHESTVTLLADFGTARESTLAQLRSISEEQWNTGEPTSIRMMVTRLAANDKKMMERIVGLLGSP